MIPALFTSMSRHSNSLAKVAEAVSTVRSWFTSSATNLASIYWLSSLAAAVRPSSGFRALISTVQLRHHSWEQHGTGRLMRIN